MPSEQVEQGVTWEFIEPTRSCAPIAHNVEETKICFVDLILAAILAEEDAENE